MQQSRRYPRFTVRRLMVVVAIAAIPCWVLDRGYRFRGLSESHRSKVGFLGFHLDTSSGDRALSLTGERGKPMSQPLSDWHEMLADKYEEAARRPWLPVAPDPPEPE